MLVLGARQQIDELLQKQGEAPQYAAGYRVTDAIAMQATVQAAGASRMAVEAQLSKVHCRAFFANAVCFSFVLVHSTESECSEQTMT